MTTSQRIIMGICALYVGLQLMMSVFRWLRVRASRPHPGYAVKVRFGAALGPLCGLPHNPGQFLYPHYKASLSNLAQAQGYPSYEPDFDADVDLGLPPESYVITMAGVEVGRGQLQVDKSLVTLVHQETLEDKPVAKHPVTQARSCWLAQTELPAAWAAKLPSEAPLEVLAHHLRLALVQNMHLVFYDTYSQAILDAALKQYPSLHPYSFLFKTHRADMPAIIRQSFRLGASMADKERYFGCLGRGLRSGLSNRDICRQLRDSCPVGSLPAGNPASKVAAGLLHGYLTKGGWLDSKDFPRDVESLGQTVLRCGDVERSELVQAFRVLQFRTEVSQDRSELREMCGDLEKFRPLPASDKLACILLSLPADTASGLLSGLAKRLTHAQFSRVVGTLSRMAVFLHLFGDDVEASKEVMLRDSVEEFLDFRDPGMMGPPSRDLSAESLTAEDFQNLAYQIERLYFPVLHWSSELESACRFLPEALDDLVRWHGSTASRPTRSKRASMALTTLPQPLQDMLTEELRARGCCLDRLTSTNLTESLTCELEMSSRLGTRLS